MSGAQDKTASQPIILILGDGGGDPAEHEGADHHAEWHAAISSPTVTCCRAETARTARPGPRGRWENRPASRKAAGSTACGGRRRSGSQGRPGRSVVPRRRPTALTPNQDNKTRHAERRRFDAQRPVRAENGNDGCARDEPQDLAGLVGDIADCGAEHELTDGKDLAAGGPLLGVPPVADSSITYSLWSGPSLQQASPRIPGRLGRRSLRFAGSGVCPLCWGSPRRRADTVTAATAVGAPIV
jgi:hypothetical protein